MLLGRVWSFFKTAAHPPEVKCVTLTGLHGTTIISGGGVDVALIHTDMPGTIPNAIHDLILARREKGSMLGVLLFPRGTAAGVLDLAQNSMSSYHITAAVSERADMTAGAAAYIRDHGARRDAILRRVESMRRARRPAP